MARRERERFTQYGGEREKEGKTSAVLSWYGSCGCFGCDLFSTGNFLKFAKNGPHGLRGLFGLPAIHTVWQRGDGGKISGVLSWYGSWVCFGCDLFSASNFLKFSKNGLHGLPGLCGLPAIHTVWQRRGKGRLHLLCWADMAVVDALVVIYSQLAFF